MDHRLNALANLFQYPDEQYHAAVNICRAVAPEFAAAVEQLTVSDLEELFTRTFDLNPVCSLEVGWHLYGENYSRGDFLVTMRQHLRRLGIRESHELPDHLTHVLRVLSRLDSAEAAAFAAAYVLPAMKKMLAALEGKQNPYEELLKSIHAHLTAAVPEVAHG
jgi:nitrate reductase delta subunit